MTSGGWFWRSCCDLSSLFMYTLVSYKETRGDMPVFLIFGCEIAFFSFLIGAFMHSIGLAVSVLGGSSLAMYMLFQRYYTFWPMVWGSTLLGGLSALLWGSYLDAWLGTNFIAIFLSLLSGVLCFFLNDLFFRKYQAWGSILRRMLSFNVKWW